MLVDYTLHKVLLKMNILEDGGVTPRCPHQRGGHDDCQMVSSRQVVSAVVHHSVEVLPKVPEEQVMGLWEELKSTGEWCVVFIRAIHHGTHCSCRYKNVHWMNVQNRYYCM